MSPTRLSVTRRPGRATLALRGEHDALTVERLRAELETLLEEDRAIEVDLGHATFLDSTTIGALIEAHRHAEDRGLKFALLLGPETGWPVRRLLEVTHLDDVFAVHG